MELSSQTRADAHARPDTRGKTFTPGSRPHPDAGIHEASDQTFAACRQRLIRYLIKLDNALEADLADLSQALLSRFCDSLVDYLSAGYFQVFPRSAPSPDEYAAIESTTQVAMAFNDRWGNVRSVEVRTVRVALEQLAQVLGTRFEIEDGLLLAEQVPVAH